MHEGINCTYTSPNYTYWEYVDDMADPSVMIIGTCKDGQHKVFTVWEYE
jgi:hypothetical protein